MGKKSAENIATSLIENTTLTRLNLSNNNLNQCGIHAIARAITNHRTIDSIDLSLNKINENSCQELVTALDSNPRIKTLVLSDCELSSESIQHFASSLPTSRLKALDLSKNTIDEISAIQLAHALQNNTELHSLELHNVGRNGIAHIAKALEFNSTLKSVNLSCNELNTSEIEAVAQMLCVNTSLLCINLSQNLHPLLMSLGNIEQKRNELIEYLQHHPVPEINVIELFFNPDLVINWCKKLAFLSTKQLISAVAVNSILQSIYLCHNQYNDFDAVAIANMLAVNQGLEVICLRSNSIGNKGVKAIAKSLEVNNSLKTLYLESNDFYGEGAQVLAAATHINLTLEELSTDLYLCPIQVINIQLFMNLIIEHKACAIPFLLGAGQASPRPLAEIFFD